MMRVIKFDTRDELEQFMESADIVAEIAKGEYSFFGDSCDNCVNEFDVIVSGGQINYYLCLEHFKALKQLMS